MLPVTIRKRRILVRVNVNQKGQAIVDKRHLPASAIAITGVIALAQPGKVTAPVVPVFLYGAAAAVPTSGAVLNQGALTLASGNSPATAQFTQSAGADQCIYYAYPATLPKPRFDFMGFIGGFVEVGSIYANVTVGSSQKPVAFRLWKSVTPNLGTNVALTVTHP